MNKEIKNIFEIIKKEKKRQNNGLELIASENYVSKNILKANGSILTNKYAEGLPNARYYGGCCNIDLIENIAIQKCCELFNVKFANVQPHSGSQANAAAYRALEKYLKIKDRKMKILSCELNEGGHLTHGSKVSFSSNLYDFCFYHLNKNNKIDIKIIEKAIIENKPDVLLIGYSSYPYQINFKEIKKLCNKHKIKLIVDMAHIAGLVASEQHQNPCEYADIVTSTTHKTLRGPRGGIILTNNEELFKEINKAVFPYYQGGPLEHIIAAKAICFIEAKSEKFKKYCYNLIINCKVCCETLNALGAKTYGTENHLFLLDTLNSYGLTGLQAQEKLEEINITTNKNMLPNDIQSPKNCSGLRIGFAALTTRGCTTEISIEIAKIINDYLSNFDTKENCLKRVKIIIKKLRRI